MTEENELISPLEIDLNADFSEENDYVVLTGKVFECGSYDDKKFSLTPEEAEAAVRDFTPVKVDLEHRSTPLDGKLGWLQKVFLADNKKDIHGELHQPKWLDKALGSTPRKVSLTFDRITKKIVGIALVNHPRIADAQLQAAFAEFVESQRTSSAADDTSNQSSKETTPMSDVQNSSADFEAAKAENEALKAKLEAQEAALAQFKADKRHTEAEKLADELIAAKKAFPAEKAAIVAMFEQASKDDEANPAEVHFAEGDNGKGNRVDGLKAMFAARPEHKLDVEMLKNDPEAMEKLSVLFTKQTTENKDGAISPERRAKLLGHSSLGLTVLKEGK